MKNALPRLTGLAAIIAAASCRHGSTAPPVATAAAAHAGAGSVRERWQMQSSAVAPEGGAEVSSPSYDAAGWYPVTVPSTVMAGLIENGEYADVFRGKNLASVDTKRFESPWWYRETFALPLPPPGTGLEQAAWLDLKGINYRAEVWLNGVRIADPATIVGTYRDFELNVSPHVKYGGAKNVLAIKVFKPAQDDLDITFTDWAPAPPDQNMGIWQDARVTTSGPVRVRHPYVETDLDVPSLSRARLSILADLANATAKDVAGTLRATVADPAGRPVATCAKRVAVPARPDGATFRLTAGDCPALDVAHPDVWWPWQLGGQPRYTATVEFVPQAGAVASDHASVRFGVRKTTSRIDHGHRLFAVNGVDILIVGAGYAPDLFQRRSFPHRPDWQEDQLRFLRDLNLNTVRLEGKLEDDAFYDFATSTASSSWPDGMCCNAWEKWGTWDPARWDVYKESLRTQLRRARSHPSMLAWLHGSDNPPDSATAERAALDIETGLEWPNPVVSNAGYSPGPAVGSDRVQDARPVHVRSADLLVRGHAVRGRVRLQHRGRPVAGAPGGRDPQGIPAARAPVAHRRRVALPLHGLGEGRGRDVQRRARSALRQADGARGLRVEGAGPELRDVPRDVRGVQHEQARRRPVRSRGC